MAYNISVAAGTREMILWIWKSGDLEIWKSADTLAAGASSGRQHRTRKAGEKELRSFGTPDLLLRVFG
jgi:hypothetical protein